MDYPLYNSTLCPDIWDKKDDDYVMKKEILDTLNQIIKDFEEEYIKESDLSVDFDDVVIVGSSTNYNWSPYSDIDLHIMIDYSKMDMEEEEASALLDGLKSKWNNKHDIKIKGHALEINFAGLNDESSITSIFSILNNKWVMKPIKEKPVFNKDVIKKKHAGLKAKLEMALKSTNEELLKKLLDKLYSIRQAGLDEKGEFSEENIVFKILRAQGYIDKLKDHIANIYDGEMTINELAYKGNIGVMEIVKFYDKANPRQIAEFEKLANEETPEATKKAWLLIQIVSGVKLMGDEEFGTQEELDNYKKTMSEDRIDDGIWSTDDE